MKTITDLLICPVCGAAMTVSDDGKSLICAGGARGNKTPRRHCFDFASGGYVNLAPPSQSLSGDSREAVVSRTRFLEAGYYDPIRDAVCEALSTYSRGGLAVDAGCGEGYYTAAAAKHTGAILGLDLSKFGVDTAAKRARRQGLTNTLFTVAGIYSIPLRDGCADAVISMFAPCAEEEFSRILGADGILIAVGAGEDHLYGLKRAVYDEVYKNTDRADMPKSLALVERKELRFEISLRGNAAIRDLFSMTPYFYRTSERDWGKLSALDELDTEVHAFVEVYCRGRRG